VGRDETVPLDIGLPGLNGYDVAQRIRKNLGMTNITIAAMTGWSQDDDRRRSKEAGFDDHLMTPVVPAALDALQSSLADKEIGFKKRKTWTVQMSK
jgi:two-component system, chemotaxis family, CheB/CheR fusion protein